MDADRMARSLARIAHEILERNRGVEELALVGIRTRGVPLARRLAASIRDIHHHDVRQILRSQLHAFAPVRCFANEHKAFLFQ